MALMELFKSNNYMQKTRNMQFIVYSDKYWLDNHVNMYPEITLNEYMSTQQFKKPINERYFLIYIYTYTFVYVALWHKSQYSFVIILSN